MILWFKLSCLKGPFDMPTCNPIASLALSTTLVLSVAGCGDQRANEVLFVALGSIGGAVIGSQIGHGDGRAVATAVGGVLGAYTAQQALWWMEEQDRKKSESALNRALETGSDGQRVVWSNPDSGASGYALAGKTGSNASEVDCRTYETFVTNGSEQNTDTGTACRSSDGSWRVQSSS